MVAIVLGVVVHAHQFGALDALPLQAPGIAQHRHMARVLIELSATRGWGGGGEGERGGISKQTTHEHEHWHAMWVHCVSGGFAGVAQSLTSESKLNFRVISGD